MYKNKVLPPYVQGDFAQVLTTGEQIEKAYQLIEYLFVFTNKRLILVDKHGTPTTRSSSFASVQEHRPL
jgi:hypothetical protein